MNGMVFLVEDDTSMRESVSSLIRSAGHDARTFESAQEFLSSERPDIPCCLVCDVQLPGLSGLDLQRKLVESGERIPIIFISGHGDIAMTVRAMKAGAMEFLAKPFREQQLLEAIRTSLEHDAARRDESCARAHIQARWNSLTPREREVVTRVLTGALNKQVAAELGVSEITVKIHRRNALRKMRVSSVLALSRLAGHIGAGR